MAGLLLVLASGIVVYEYNSSSKQSALKALRAEEQELAEKQLLESRFRELREQIDGLRCRLDQVERDRSAVAERTTSVAKNNNSFSPPDRTSSDSSWWLSFPFYSSTPTTKQ
jgi:Tfp pilus assembly protein PilO